MYRSHVLADSIADGVRLTTLEVNMPRIVLSEFNTHRMISKNSASSRAIPVEKRIQQVKDNPFIPEAFMANQRGMQAGDVLDDEHQALAKERWQAACFLACQQAEALAEYGVHKQWANRLLEPFSWHTVICTATEWENFFALRISKHAQPEIRRTAETMLAAMESSTPEQLKPADWHLPMIFKTDRLQFGIEQLIQLSVARCARVSYLTHDGKRDPQADFSLYTRLVSAGHMSPLEHVAQVSEHPNDAEFVGNFRRPWIQYRKTIAGESVFRES